MLTSVAELTGGEYFRATDTEELERIYDVIDELEKTEVEEIIYTDYKDLYGRYLGLALFFFFIGFTLNKTILNGTETS